MANKNIQMRIKNGSSWDDLFPKTKASLVDVGNGKTLESHVTEILASIATKATHADIDTRIKAVIGSAPAAMDTLREIADALNNDADFATTITNQLKNKISRSEFDALKSKVSACAHPPTHPATIITQDGNHRFVSDSEKTKWNSKSKVSVSKLAPNDADIWYQEI